MGEQFFDDLAKGLDDGTLSRRRALRLFGAAALGAALMPVMPEQAEALGRRFRRRCRRKGADPGGIPLERGDCHCGWQCGPDPSLFSCHGNTNCTCYKDASGRGFCGTGTGNGFCTQNSDCDPGRKCAVNTCAGNLCIASCPT
jgi:hypothetical protein